MWHDLHGSTNTREHITNSTHIKIVYAHLKTDHTTKTSHLLHGKLMLGMTLQPRIIDTLHLQILPCDYVSYRSTTKLISNLSNLSYNSYNISLIIHTVMINMKVQITKAYIDDDHHQLRKKFKRC
jgi:hypothetical protein